MSIARTLVDIIGVTSSTAKVGYGVIATQSAALQQHLKTSSLLNPTPIIVQTPHSATPKATATNTADKLDTQTTETAINTNEKQIDLTPGLPSSSSTPSLSPNATISPSTKVTQEEFINSIDQQIESPDSTLEAKEQEQVRRNLKEARIPTSRVGRLWHYGSLATGMGLGAINESFKRATGISKSQQGSVMLSEKNVDRLVEKLSTMRGAALKMGQMLSIQGIQASNQSSSALPPQLEQVLLRVHDSANYMPKKQMEKVMSDELGKNWLSNFQEFDPIPIAAASIGQVHAATLSNGQAVVIKIQYPGVATSIDSDLSNLKALVTFSNLLPRGLYLDNTIKVTKQELAWECDYVREASNAQKFEQLLKGDIRYKVPHIIEDLCTSRVLVCERLNGQVLSKAIDEPQNIRNKLGENLLRLCLREVFSFQFMQTDPNWSNFFYNRHTGQIELLDFGACREFPSSFLQLYGRILGSAARQDRDGVWEYSKQLGFVTGYETDVMKQAHINSVMVLGEPFTDVAPDMYDFSQQTITSRVRDSIPVMLQHRLTPPPDETYGLHKKLSGAFLLCTKLGSKFDTKNVWKEEVEQHFRF
ncbi:ABC1 family-domain-containing protein [Absidia repens]|uniref:ABC1 family-domain-containing protein n=1 Tax=Absidia repens TaxID=90262 RepID=A0A1X2IL31_9FUNG|nr:ABC1 family-domain-containing protein [Absidia repens]